MEPDSDSEQQGSNFRTHSLFYNDSWRVNGRLTANLGVRCDKNHGMDQQGKLVTNDQRAQPAPRRRARSARRSEVVGHRQLREVRDAIANSIADASSAAGNSQTYQFRLPRTDINPDANAARWSTRRAAIAAGVRLVRRERRRESAADGAPTIPGVTPQIGDDLKSPSVFEYAAGVNRQFGTRAALRVDFVYRDYRDFYVQRTDQSTGTGDQSRSARRSI